MSHSHSRYKYKLIMENINLVYLGVRTIFNALKNIFIGIFFDYMAVIKTRDVVLNKKLLNWLNARHIGR